ncbi:MAG: Uma2 family endonuclease [Imperialibacter sp.]
MATEVMKRLINVDEYYKMAEVGILKPEDRVELINGEIYEMSPIGNKHYSAVNKASNFLKEVLLKSVIVSVQNPIRINEGNEPEPDICLLKPRNDFYVNQFPGPNDALLIIEVADSSLQFDREVKSVTYALAGIPVYWIINLKENVLEVYSDPGKGRYQSSSFKNIDSKVSLPFIDLEILVSEIMI